MEAKRIGHKAGGRSYGRIAFDLPAARADEAGAIIVALGAMGCESSKLPRAADAPPRALRIARLSAWFDETNPVRLKRIAKTIGAAAIPAEIANLKIDCVRDPGWATMWMDRFSPFTIGQHFLIVPPWQRDEAESERTRTRIVIQPGQGFGTGHHGSTYGVMRTLEELYRERCWRSALDVGTGSGILAIAMKLLGTREVTAIDNDPMALDNARENAALNSVDGEIRISPATLASIRRRFDLITANILAPVLIAMAPKLKRNLARDGRLILAGILKREADEVVAAYAPELRCAGRRNDRGWTALVMAHAENR